MHAAYGDLAQEASALVKKSFSFEKGAHDERPAGRRRKVVVRIRINALCDAHALPRARGMCGAVSKRDATRREGKRPHQLERCHGKGYKMVKVGPEFDLVASVRGHAWPGLEPPFNLHVEATVSLVKVDMVPNRRPSVWSDPVVIANLDEDAADKEWCVNDGRSARVVDMGKNCVIAMRATGAAQEPTRIYQRKRRRTAERAVVCSHPYLELLHHLVIAEREQMQLKVLRLFCARCEKWRARSELSRRRLRMHRTSSQCRSRSNAGRSVHEQSVWILRWSC